MVDCFIRMNKRCKGILLDSQELAKTSKFISTDEVQISFYGTGNTGKSTLINALLGEK